MNKLNKILNGRALPLFFLGTLGIGLTTIFALMWVFGAVKAVEPNIPIRLGELLLVGSITLYAIWQLVRNAMNGPEDDEK